MSEKPRLPGTRMLAADRAPGAPVAEAVAKRDVTAPIRSGFPPGRRGGSRRPVVERW